MDETSFFHQKNSCKLVVFKGSSNVWSKCSDTNFHTDFVICVSVAKFVALQLLTLPANWFNMDVLEGCDIEGAHVTTSPKGSINYTLFSNWIELFANSVPGPVVRPLVLVYGGCYR